MNWFDFQNIYSIIKNDQLCLAYRGDFADEITVRLIDISDLQFHGPADRLNMRKKVAFLMAECFQNVIRHGEISPYEVGLPQYSGFFMTRNISGDYIIASGNLIESQYVTNLKGKIENINKLSPVELKDLYMKVLGTDELTSKGGAGLGLIEMARKSGRKLESYFRDINDKLAFFYLQILIGVVDNNVLRVPSDNHSISNSVELNELLTRNNVLMAYQGDFRQDSILPLLNMINRNIQNIQTENYLYKTIFHVLVEMLQNIMHHGYTYNDKREGIFTIAVSQKKFNICAANYVENDKSLYLKEILEKFLTHSNGELKDMYKQILREGPRETNGGAGLGLIDIIRSSSILPDYKLIKIDDEKSLFYLNVVI
jgi:hypothetical protein